MDLIFRFINTKLSKVIIVVALILVMAVGAGCTVNRGVDEPSVEVETTCIEWLDFYFDEQMPWDGHLDLELSDYPGTLFRWTPYEVKAIVSGTETTLFYGMPIWNVFVADLSGDGLPEFCATVSFGSGIIDERIIVCDYAAGKTYELSDRAYYDYALYLNNGKLMVNQTMYLNSERNVIATGELAIIDGELVAIGIDRTRPKD